MMKISVPCDFAAAHASPREMAIALSEQSGLGNQQYFQSVAVVPSRRTVVCQGTMPTATWLCSLGPRMATRFFAARLTVFIRP